MLAIRLPISSPHLLKVQNSLVSAFNETIEVYSRMYALVEDLRCAIGEHDADISPVVGSYENVEDLIASLR